MSLKAVFVFISLTLAGLLIFQIINVFLLSSDFPNVQEDAWQAVFLSNNQVYFGHLEELNKGYVALTDIYYLQANQLLQQGAAAPDLSLVKLGSELHGPQDLMYIPKENIIFWENLGGNSQIVQAINNFAAQQTQQ